MTLELIQSEVLKLNRFDRIQLAQLIMDSIAKEEKLQTGQDDEIALTDMQMQEIESRLKDFKAGNMNILSVETVHEKLKQKYGLHA